MKHHLDDMKSHQWATTIKLIQDWQPTYCILCWQGREWSPIYPWCLLVIETPSQIRECTHPDMLSYPHNQLPSFLTNLEQFHTLPCIITTFEYKLSLALHLQYSTPYPILSTLPPPTHQLLIQAIWHQNRLGWDMALKVILPNSGEIFKIPIWALSQYVEIGMLD